MNSHGTRQHDQQDEAPVNAFAHPDEYAAGLEAVTIVWVAKLFTEEHRATLDWLNRITDESFRFFGAEIELWRIGSSPVAPRFNIVAKPNDWTRSVAEAKRVITDEPGEPSEKQNMQREYWSGLHQALNALAGVVSGDRTAQAQPWMNYSIGRAGFLLGACMIRPRKAVRAELYIDGSNAKTFFRMLSQQQADIEGQLGYPLEWEEMPGRRACRISTYLRPADPDDKLDWPRQQDWLARRLNELHRVFAQRIRALDADAMAPEETATIPDQPIVLEE